MCARYTLRRRPAEVAQAFQARLEEEAEAMQPRFNIAPSQAVLVVSLDDGGRPVLRPMRWGLVPYWAKDESIGAKLINARIETAREKPSFRDAIKHRRCLIPVDGFYEWTAKHDGQRQPHFIHRRDDGLLAFAGLWDRWQDAHGNELSTCAILTTQANEQIRPLHHRMPVLVDPDNAIAWLQARSADDAVAFIQRTEGLDLDMHPVSTRVNRPTNDDPRCIEPAHVEHVDRSHKRLP